MKFPSLSRMPKYKRFNFEPRYYDSVKEDIQNRTERIKRELKITSVTAHREHIKSAFNRRAKQQQSSDLMQILLIILMLGAVGGWLFFGNVVLYICVVVFPLYFFFRTRKFFQ